MRRVRGAVYGMLALGCAALAGRAQTKAWDVGQGGDFATLQEAIDAASDGDVIFMLPGDHTTKSEVKGKSVAIVAEYPEQTRIRPWDYGTALVARDLPLDRAVVLVGLHVQAFAGNAFAVIDADVRLTGCELRGSNGSFCEEGGDALYTHGARVAISGSHLEGGSGSGSNYYCNVGAGGDAVRATDSSDLLVHSSRVLGGIGGWAGFAEDDGGTGGRGLFLLRSSLFGAASDFVGGPGGKGADKIAAHPPGCGGDGGIGAVLWEGADLNFLGCDFEKGIAGPPGDPGDCWGEPGSRLSVHSEATIRRIPGLPRSFHATTVVRNGVAELSFNGWPKDRVFLLVSERTLWKPSPGVNPYGTHLVRATRVIPIGKLSFNGQLDSSWAPPLPKPGDEARVWHVQALFLSQGGKAYLGEYRTIVVAP